FFFSSRRRHTRFSRDWSSDVCSSDLWAPNCYEWTLLQYATARIGVILVNLNPAYRAHEVSFAMNQSEIKLVVSALSFKTSDYKNMLTLVREDCPSLQEVVYLNEDWDEFLATAVEISDEVLRNAENAVQFDDPVNI